MMSNIALKRDDFNSFSRHEFITTQVPNKDIKQYPYYLLLVKLSYSLLENQLIQLVKPYQLIRQV